MQSILILITSPLHGKKCGALEYLLSNMYPRFNFSYCSYNMPSDVPHATATVDFLHSRNAVNKVNRIEVCQTSEVMLCVTYMQEILTRSVKLKHVSTCMLHCSRTAVLP